MGTRARIGWGPVVVLPPLSLPDPSSRPARLLDVVADRSGDAYGGWLDAARPEWRRPRSGSPRWIRSAATSTRCVRTCRTPPTCWTRSTSSSSASRRSTRSVAASSRNRPATAATPATRSTAPGDCYAVGATDSRLHHVDKLNVALGEGDPHGEVTIAWHAAQALAGAFARTDRPAGARQALEVIATYIDCPVPEVARLARTLRTWQPQLLACSARSASPTAPPRP